MVHVLIVCPRNSISREDQHSEHYLIHYGDAISHTAQTNTINENGGLRATLAAGGSV